MLKAVRRFKPFSIWLLAVLIWPSLALAQEGAEFKPSETSLGRDFFEQNVFYEGTNYLHLDRLYRGLFKKEVRAKDINVFDEVPDNLFFTNRHARTPLTPDELSRGFRENEGPDEAGSLTITGGHFAEINTSLFVKDKRGDEYLLKFDHADHLELQTASEIIANRVYHALGYNVPQTTIVNLDASQLVPGENAKVVDGTGFFKKLTQQRLDQYLMFMPQTGEGKYRALAMKAVRGEHKGGFKFQGRRRNDPNDSYDHETRREIRGLQVFASWLNHTDIRMEKTQDVLVEQDGKKVLKHYLMESDAALGSDAYGSKPASFGFDHFVDFGGTVKAILGFGIWEKPWQKRVKETSALESSPAVGSFDNLKFNPGKFKTELPNYAFKDLTDADGFWAAKQIMSFKDSDIAAIVKAAGLTEAADAEKISNILIQRRDLVGRYWFEKANPLDSIDVQGGKLTFEDLAVKYNFQPAAGTIYHLDVISKAKKRGKKVASLTSNDASFSVDSGWGKQADLLLRVSRSGSALLSPYVLAEITDGKISGIRYQD